MNKFIGVIAVLFFSSCAFSMQYLPRRLTFRIINQSFCTYAHKPITCLIDDIRCSTNKNKQVSADYFNKNINTKDVLKILKEKLYVIEGWPHVDPTVGKSGYCQLIAGFLDSQLGRLKKLDLKNCDEEDTRALLPLVKAFIIQEIHNPKKYKSLSPNSVKQRLEKDLNLIHENKSLSQSQADLILDRTQESFMKDLFDFTKTNKSSDIMESMITAMDIIDKSECLLHLRYYNGSPSRPDIFSSVQSPNTGNLYKRSLEEPNKWRKLSGGKLKWDEDQTNIIQVHFEYQPALQDRFYIYGLDQKPEIKKRLEKNRELDRIIGTDDKFGFGDDIFDLREFVMQGVKAINDPELDFLDPEHPITVPGHFSVVPGIQNLGKLLSFGVYLNPEKGPQIISGHTNRKNYAYAPLQIHYYVRHYANISPDNPITWVLTKKFKDIDVTLGLAYDKNNNIIIPEYSFLTITEGVEIFIDHDEIHQSSESLRDLAFSYVEKNYPLVSMAHLEHPLDWELKVHNGLKKWDFNVYLRVPTYDINRKAQIYKEFINKYVRDFTKPDYLYPQARFLLKEAKITAETIDDLLQEDFIEKLLTNSN